MGRAAKTFHCLVLLAPVLIRAADTPAGAAPRFAVQHPVILAREVRRSAWCRSGKRSVMSRTHTPLLHRMASALPASKPRAAALKAARAEPVEVCAISAVPDGESTLISLEFTRNVRPVLTLQGNRISLALPGTQPAAGLPAHMSGGGLVSRLSLRLPATPTTPLRLDLALSAPVRADWENGEKSKGNASQSALASKTRTAACKMWLRLTPTGPKAAVATVRALPDGSYDVEGYQADVALLLKSLARDSGTSVILAGTVASKVTVDLRNVTLAQAVALITKAAGLACHEEGRTFVVGSVGEMEAAYPKPVAPPAPPLVAVKPEIAQEVYTCRYIIAADLVTALEKTFDKEVLRVALGVGPSSPHLDAATTEAVTGVTAAKSSSASSGGSDAGDPQRAHSILLLGDPHAVASALTLAARLDVRRAQVRINVTISDIALDAERDLGIRWNLGNITFGESGPRGIHFGTLTRTGLEAQLTALETANRAKLLAAPTISLLDGERGYILIGERLLFPKLIGYTPANTPIYDKEEVRVGIYLQVAAQIGADGDITMMIYPQVSTIVGYLQIPNVGSYPQIGTREQQTTIRVHDGERIVVGGLIRNEDIENVQRVPLLSRIPFFGELFTYRQKIKHASDVVVTITPQILKD